MLVSSYERTGVFANEAAMAILVSQFRSLCAPILIVVLMLQSALIHIYLSPSIRVTKMAAVTIDADLETQSHELG
jgi:hypothetical protein